MSQFDENGLCLSTIRSVSDLHLVPSLDIFASSDHTRHVRHWSDSRQTHKHCNSPEMSWILMNLNKKVTFFLIDYCWIPWIPTTKVICFILRYILLAPLTTSAQRSWCYYWLSVVRRLSVNFCFKSLLLLQFLFNNSEFFTGETRHIVPPCNKAGISNSCLEFQKLQKFQISWKRYSSYSSYSKILNFLLEKLGI